MMEFPPTVVWMIANIALRKLNTFLRFSGYAQNGKLRLPSTYNHSFKDHLKVRQH